MNDNGFGYSFKTYGEDEKAHEVKQKRKIESDESDTDLEDGEVSFKSTDTEPEPEPEPVDNLDDVILPPSEMCAAEKRQQKNIEEREKLWSQQEEHYI